MGLAPRLAIAALVGAWLGAHFTPPMPALVAATLLASLAAARRGAVLLLLVLSVSAVQVLLARGAVLPVGLTGQDLHVEARIDEVDDEGRFVRLRATLGACRPLDARLPGCERLRQVRVSWYDAPSPRAGERWALTLRLRPPAGFANPHAFDYAAWLWREGIDATGYVRDAPQPRRLAAAGMTLRTRALDYLDRHVEDPLAQRWLAALTLGAGERLNDADWDLLNASGTTHLMVISGLHVGLVAAFMLALTRLVARLTMPGRWRMAAWPWWCAALAAVGYAWLAGLEPPALRAMIMTLIGLWVASGRHAPGPWQGWWLALAVVVMLDPLALWRPGLWLSFVAVGWLILAWQGRARPRGLGGWLWALLRSQCLLAPLMGAAVLFTFERLAPASPLVNLLATPLVGSVMVPLGLAGWLLAWWPPLAALVWSLFALLAHGVEAGLQAAVAWFPLWQPAPWQIMPLALGLLMLGALWTLPGLPRSLRGAGSVALLVASLYLAPPPFPEGRLRVRVHDVGQGQLIELRTAGHRLLYDTGPRFGSGFMPLASLWPPGQDFDAVIVSHGDLDHAGGVAALREDHRVRRWWTPLAASLDVPASSCRAGKAWRWDGVEFRFLWPAAPLPQDLQRNDRSCVLQVTAGGERLLITGDVGTAVEARLLDDLVGPVDVLVAGHHGSATSSSAAWVAATRPAHAIFSAGRANAHGHPHPAVVRRFREVGSCLWNTAVDGALTVWLGGPGPVTVSPWRRGVEGGCHALESLARENTD